MTVAIIHGYESKRRRVESFFDWVTQSLAVDMFGYIVVGICCIAVGMLARVFVSVSGTGQAPGTGDEVWPCFELLETLAGWFGPFVRGNWGGLVELFLFLLTYLCSVKYRLDRNYGRRHPLRDLLGLRSGMPLALLTLVALSFAVFVAFVRTQRANLFVSRGDTSYLNAAVIASLAYALVGFSSVTAYTWARFKGDAAAGEKDEKKKEHALTQWRALVRYRLLWPSLYVTTLCLFHGFEWTALAECGVDLMQHDGSGLYPVFVYAVAILYLLLYRSVTHNNVGHARISRLHLILACVLVFVSVLFGKSAVIVGMFIGMLLSSYEAWAITGELWERWGRTATEEDPAEAQSGSIPEGEGLGNPAQGGYASMAEQEQDYSRVWEGYVCATNVVYCVFLVAIPVVLPLVMSQNGMLSSGPKPWHGFAVPVAVIAYSGVFLSGWYINSSGFSRLGNQNKDPAGTRRFFWMAKIAASLLVAFTITGCVLFPDAVRGLGKRLVSVALPFCEFFEQNQVVAMVAGTVLSVVQVLSKHGGYSDDAKSSSGGTTQNDGNASPVAVRILLTIEKWIGGYVDSRRYDAADMPGTFIVIGLLGALIAFVLGVMSSNNMWIGMSFVGLAWCTAARLSEVIMHAPDARRQEAGSVDDDTKVK